VGKNRIIHVRKDRCSTDENHVTNLLTNRTINQKWSTAATLQLQSFDLIHSVLLAN